METCTLYVSFCMLENCSSALEFIFCHQNKKILLFYAHNQEQMPLLDKGNQKKIDGQ